MLRVDGQLDPDLAVQLAGAVAAGLDYAWRKQRVTHRDVKPANILVGIDETDGAPQIESVKLADFGIAKGLTSEELDKLWSAADEVGARATFAATLDRAQACGPLWRERTAPNGRPHFALTAEHLFDLEVRGPTYNTDLFDWRDDPPGPRAPSMEPTEWATVDEAFSRYTEGSPTDHLQLRRAPWMSSEFIDLMRMPPDTRCDGPTPSAADNHPDASTADAAN